MTRKEFAKSIIEKCEKLLNSVDLDYEYEEVPIDDRMVFQIYCLRVDENMAGDPGTPITLEFYVEKDGVTIEGVSIDPFKLKKYPDEIDYVLRCVTDWN